MAEARRPFAAPGVRVERHPVIPAERAAELFPLYEATFGPLREKAAARHLLTLEEFTEEMVDPRIDKWVATREDDGSFLAVSLLARDIEAVPWASAGFYTARYPEHAARDAIWYLGFTMTIPGVQKEGVFATVLAAMVEESAAAGAIVGWDMCAANVEAGFNAAVAAQLAAGAGVPVVTEDVQTYFSVDLSGGA